METNDENILGFWQWFIKNESIIKDCIENENSTHKEFVVEHMDEQILSFGVLTWDIGLNEQNKWFFMLSPNGSKDNLEVSQKIMAVAPEHMDWLFYASRPAKNWDRNFTVYNNEMDEEFIDASPWHYVVFEEDDGTIELLLEAQNINRLDIELAETAAEQFVIQEVGEKPRILNISSIIIEHTLDDEYQDSKSPVSELKEHLEEIF